MKRTRLTLLCALVCACAGDPGYGGRRIDDWIMDLRSADPATRLRATNALGRILDISPKATGVVPALVGVLDDTVDTVRLSAAIALIAEGVVIPATGQVFHDALHDSAHPLMRATALSALTRFERPLGDVGRSALLEAFRDSDEGVRRAAITAAQDVARGDTVVGTAVATLLGDQSAAVRSAAASALKAWRR